MTNETRACPYCGEEILALAIKCKHCKSDLGGSAIPTQQPLINPNHWADTPGSSSGERRTDSLRAPQLQQFQKWEKTRQGGRTRFVWLYGVLGWGVTCGILFGALFGWLFPVMFRGVMSSLPTPGNVPSEVSNDALASATDGTGQVILVLSMILFPIGGYIFGAWMWKMTEKKYQQALDGN